MKLGMIYFSVLTKPTFKLYVDGKYLGESLQRNGFDMNLVMPVGGHVLEVRSGISRKSGAVKASTFRSPRPESTNFGSTSLAGSRKARWKCL